MNIVKFGEHNVVFGLHWIRLQGHKLTSEIVEALKERNSSVGLTRKIADEYDQRVQLGVSEDKSAKGAYSAASMVCSNEGSVIFIEKLNDNEYWLAATTQNEVLPGGDLIGTGEYIAEKLREWLAEFGGAASEVRIFCSQAACDDLSIEPSEVCSFEEYAFANGHLFNNSNKVTNIKVMPKPASLFMLTVVLVLAGYFFMSSNKSPVSSIVDVLPGETPFQAIERVNLPLGPSEDDLLAAALMEELKWLREDFERYSPSAIISSVSQVAETIPKFKGGWTAVTATYNNKKRKRSVRIEWRKGTIGTTSTLLEGLDIESREFTKGGITAFTYHKLPNKKKRKVGRDVLHYISNTKYSMANLMDDFQKINGTKWNIDNSTGSARPVRIEGIKSKTLANERQLKQPFKIFSASHETTASLYSVINELKEADSVIVTGVRLNLNSKNWKVSGKLYEK